MKSCLIRLNLRKNKATAAVEKARRDIVVLLKGGDDEKARIIGEQGIKEEKLVEALEELKAICEEVVSRLGVISSSRRLPLDLKEPICTLIWGSSCLNIKELELMRQQFALKFGANLDHEALCNIDNCVSERMIELLSAKPPPEDVVFSYLKGVAAEYSVDWGVIPEEEDDFGDSAVQDIYGSFMSGMDVSTPASNGESLEITMDDFPDVAIPDGVDFEKKEISSVDNIDEFDAMFSDVPSTDLPVPVTPSILSGAISLKAQVVQQTVQKIQLISPVQSVQPVQQVKSIQSVQSIQSIQPQKISTISLQKSDSGDLKQHMGKNLAEMDSKALEAQFEELFNCSMDSIDLAEPTREPILPSISLVKVPITPIEENLAPISTISLVKSVEPVEPKPDEHLVVSVATTSEYDDLFSAPVPEATPTVQLSEFDLDEPQEQDYDDIFSRLSSVSTTTTEVQENNPSQPGVTIIDSDMSAAEWEARFNSPVQPSTFDFSSQSVLEPTPVTSAPASLTFDEDDIMARFKAL